jgi:DNA-binding NtrC family response regulator
MEAEETGRAGRDGPRPRRAREDRSPERTTHRGRVLVCDDDANLLNLTREILEAEGHQTDGTVSAREAISLLEEKTYDLVLADLVMPEIGGLDLLREAKRRSAETEVIIITGHGDIDSAVQAIKQGAYDYITKPFHAEKLAIDVQKALERKRLSEDIALLRRRTEGRDRLGHLLGRSPAMASLFNIIERVAPTESTVMILGESGTGKELTAREIHRQSNRRSGPFVTVSCGTLPSNLLESELFGHTRGAFTGASSSKPGLFEAASGGTVFLDEVGATETRTQVTLLRVLQEKEVRRIGSTRARSVNARVIAATNLDLEKAMDEGTFRTDLFYRLNGVALRLPPLRDRAEDIPLLAGHFLSRYGTTLKRAGRTLSPRALELLCGYAWPGNVRELENVIEHAVIFSTREVIRPRDLPPALRQSQPGSEQALRSLREIERDHIAQVLRQTNGNKLKAARILLCREPEEGGDKN